MKFLTRAITLVLVTSLLLNTVSLSAEGFSPSAWASSFFSSAPKTVPATNPGFQDWAKSFFPPSVPAAKSVKTAVETLPAWMNKFNVSFNPVRGAYSLYKSARNNPMAAALLGTTACFLGYYLVSKYNKWSENQFEEREYIQKGLLRDRNHRSEDHEQSVLIHANNLQTPFFTKDTAAISSITDFYTWRKSNPRDKAGLKERYKIVKKRLWWYWTWPWPFS
jgi:hypothetical protein